MAVVRDFEWSGMRLQLRGMQHGDLMGLCNMCVQQGWKVTYEDILCHFKEFPIAFYGIFDDNGLLISEYEVKK